MYAILCSAADKALDELQGISDAAHAEQILLKALLEAEEIYIETEKPICEN